MTLKRYSMGEAEMALKFRFTTDAINKMTRKTWMLYLHWLNSNHEVDEEIYLSQRKLTEDMLAQVPEAERVRCKLP